MTISIGRLAELSGLPVKTIRFYSDERLLDTPERTEAGHRRFDEADLARLQLIRSLRDLGLDLPTIRSVLDGHGALPEVIAAHVRALETRIRGLQRQLVVLRAAATSPSEDTVRRVHQLARLDAAERRQLLDTFWDRALEGVPIDEATAARFRAMGSPELPAEPTPEQLDAWLELAELATDEDFQATTRRNAMWAPGARRGLRRRRVPDRVRAGDGAGARGGRRGHRARFGRGRRRRWTRWSARSRRRWAARTPPSSAPGCASRANGTRIRAPRATGSW